MLVLFVLGALGRTPAKVSKVIDVSALNQGPQAAVPSNDRSEKLFLALAEHAKQIRKLKHPELIMTNDMVLLNSPKTPSRLRRSETGELQRGAFELQRNSFAASSKLPTTATANPAALTMPSHILSSSTNDLYRTPTKLQPSSSGGHNDKGISGLNLEMGHSSSPRSGSASNIPLSQRVPAASSSALLSHHMPHTTASAYAPHTSHAHLHSSQARRDSAADFDADGSGNANAAGGNGEDEGWKVECAKLETDYEEATNRGESVAQANIAWKLGMLCKANGAAIKGLAHLASSKESLDKLDPFLYVSFKPVFLGYLDFMSLQHIANFFFKNLARYEDLDFTPQVLHYQMGLLSRVVQDIPQAQIFFKDAIKLALQDEDRLTLMLSYQEMGYCLFKLEQWLQALDYFNSYLSELVARYLHSDTVKPVASPLVGSMKFSTPPSFHSRASSAAGPGPVKAVASSSSTSTTNDSNKHSITSPSTPPIPEDAAVEHSSSDATVNNSKSLSHEDFETMAHTCYNIAYACHKLTQVALAEKFCRRYVFIYHPFFSPPMTPHVTNASNICYSNDLLFFRLNNPIQFSLWQQIFELF